MDQATEAAVLDACILFRGVLTDLLLCLAEAGCFDPVWSDEIHSEWERNLRLRPGMSSEKVAYRRAMMETAFPAAGTEPDAVRLAEVLGYCSTDDERKDAHVIACALTAGARIIVTSDLGFGVAGIARSRFDIPTLSPDEFCLRLLDQVPAQFVAGTASHRASMTRPSFDRPAYLRLLGSERVGVPHAAARLAALSDAI